MGGRRLALLLAAAAGACSPAADDRLVLEPGDGLLDLLPLARFERLPGGGLPAAHDTAGRARFILRTPVLPPAAWSPVDPPPPLWRELLATHGNPPLWHAALPATLAPGERPVRVAIHGRPVPDWTPGEGGIPLGFIWWEHSLGRLMAVGGERPVGVSVDLPVDPAAELGLLLPRDRTPAGHLARHALGDVTRPALLMPPPGVLALEVDELDAERLELSLGVVDRGWALMDDAFHRSAGLSDGVTFAVEVQPADGPAVRVSETLLGPEVVGRRWVDLRADLSPWRGQAVTIRLLSEPGHAGQADFDWALWGDLRLRGGDVERPERPHVALIHVDTLRADRVGGPASRTPRIDAWAARRAAVFRDAQAPAPWTLPSTASMLTGLAVHQHGVERGNRSLGPASRPLAERLAAVGYETWGLAAGGYLRPAFGFDQGFHRYRTAEPKNLDFRELEEAVSRRESNRPLFLFVHTYHVHAPFEHRAEWAPPEYAGPLAGRGVDHADVIDPFREGRLPLTPADVAYIAALYDGHVGVMDAAVGGLLEHLEAELGDEGLLVILTSDHGEAFVEHGVLGHGQALWDELLSVPLLVRFPHGRPALRDEPVSLLDLVPTVLDAAGLPPDPALPGHELAGRVPADRLRAARLDQDRWLECVVVAGRKLIEERDGKAERDGRGVPDGEAPRVAPGKLFDLAADPGETRDLAVAEPRAVEALRARLAEYQASHPAPAAEVAGTGDLGQAVREQLKALGYVGDG